MKLSKPWKYLMAGLILAAGAAGAQDFKPAPPDPAALTLTCVALPEQSCVALPSVDPDLAALGEVLRTVPVESRNGQDVWTFQGVPCLASKEPRALLLGGAATNVPVSLSGNANVLYVLFAVAGPATGRLAEGLITRDDGMAIRLFWDGGTNAAPSVGAWSGKLNPVAERPGTTAIVWEGQTKAGTPVRLFRTAWVNENHWYPVSGLRFKLREPSATLVVLGVTKGVSKQP